MSRVFSFPGQGAQRVGMLQTLPGSQRVKHRIDEAEQVLGCHLHTLDNQDAFQHTRNVQLALTISGVIWAETLIEQGIQPDYVQGLSIGAYPAAVIAGVLEFTDALTLVSLRGNLMQQAYPDGYGMTALLNTHQQTLEHVLQQQRQAGDDVYLANLNSDSQFVIAGTHTAMKRTVSLLKQAGHCSSRRLDVTVPSHCDLLVPQAEQLQQALSTVAMNRPSIRYLSAARARLLPTADAIRHDLAWNMASQVHWHDCNSLLAERGVTSVFEMPPGGTLTPLSRRAMAQARCLAVNDHSLEHLEQLA